jgi:hypothetical protein
LSRAVTLVLATGFAVVGVAGAASAWDNTISGTVTCATGGGWAVEWEVVNSESYTEEITESNRPSAVPVGTTLEEDETRTFTETITTKPTSDVTLELTAEWEGGEESTDSGTIELADFSDDCAIKTVVAPTVPVIDECGPGNARYGAVPTGPWTSKINADGSITVTANAGYSFPDGKTSVTFPAPTDSNQPCPAPPVVTPVVPPVVAPPQVLPAEARVARGAARSIDKCGRAGDLYQVGQRKGVVYTLRGTVLREGVWLRAKTRSIVVRASAANTTYRLEGKQVWRMKFTNRPCAKPPVIAPNTGA